MLSREWMGTEEFLSALLASPHSRTPEQLGACRQQFLDARPEGEDLWVFAYGSLLWNPLLRHQKRVRARALGLRRSFCVLSHGGRGSPERPGLVLGALCCPQSECVGVAYQISAPHVPEELELLWRREMVTGCYEPRLIEVQLLGEGEAVVSAQALCFMARIGHPQVRTDLGPAAQARLIQEAHGVAGPCEDYFKRSLSSLREGGLGNPERELLEIESLLCGSQRA